MVSANVSAKNPESVKKTQASVISSKKQDSVKTTGSKASKNEKHTFQTSSFKNTTPVIKNTDRVTLELDDILYYQENITNYQMQKGDEFEIFLIKLNKRFREKAITRKRNKKVKNGLTIFFFMFILILSGLFVMYIINTFRKPK